MRNPNKTLNSNNNNNNPNKVELHSNILGDFYRFTIKEGLGPILIKIRIQILVFYHDAIEEGLDEY